MELVCHMEQGGMLCDFCGIVLCVTPVAIAATAIIVFFCTKPEFSRLFFRQHLEGIPLYRERKFEIFADLYSFVRA